MSKRKNRKRLHFDENRLIIEFEDGARSETANLSAAAALTLIGGSLSEPVTTDHMQSPNPTKH